MIFGYALIGATWLIWKSEGETQDWARRVAGYVFVFVALAMGLVSLCMPFIDPRIAALWFSMPNVLFLAPVPLITLGAFYMLWRDLHNKRELRPFLLTIFIFLMGYIGLGISMFPWVVPFSFTLWDAAAAPSSQSLLLIGTVIFLPIILAYTAYSYYVFRGKTSEKPYY